jgi:uncharacterized protein
VSTRTEQVTFEGRAGQIDCAMDWPEDEPLGWALVLHPNPVQGGTRDNKVVTTISRACIQHALLAVRPNFRGIGESAGVFDEGRGETLDMVDLIEQFCQRHPDIAARRWVLGGFSFGTCIAAQAYAQLKSAGAALPDFVVLAGSAVLRFRHGDAEVPPDALVIHGEQDDVVALEEVMQWARPIDMPVVVIPNAGHFFHGKLLILRDLVQHRLKCL